LKMMVLLFTISLLIIAGCSGEVSTIPKNTVTPPTTVEQAAQPSTSEQDMPKTPDVPVKPPEKVIGLGDPIAIKEIKFTVESVKAYKKLGTSMFGEETKGEFYTVCMTLENMGKTSTYLYDSAMIEPQFVLVDDQERQFDSNFKYEMYIDDSIDLMEQLQPGLPVEGRKVFELPTKAKGLKLLISKGWLTNDAIAVQIEDAAVEHLDAETSMEDKNDQGMEDIMSKCSAPFKCSSSCGDMMSVGQKDCPGGEVCCMQ